MADRSALFRRAALEAEGVDEQDGAMVRLVSPRDRLGLGVLGAIVALILVWTVVGTVRVTVAGSGILLDARTGAAETDEALLSELSAPVRALLASQQRTARDALREETASALLLLAEEERLTKEARAEESARLEARIAALTEEIERLRTASTAAAQRERASLDARLVDANALVDTRRAELERAEDLRNAGALSQAAVADARQTLLDAQGRAAELRRARDLVDVDVADARLRVEAVGRELDGLIERRAALQARSLADQRANLGVAAELRGRLRDQEAEVARLELELHRQQVGVDVDAIEPVDAPELWVLLLLSAADGKRVAPGMEVAVSLDHVERARFGSLVATVREIGTRPLSAAQIEALVPVPELAAELARDGRQLAVIATLDRDPETPTGYRWSSGSGPELALSAGSTLVGRVTVERRAPVTWLLPTLRRWVGVVPR